MGFKREVNPETFSRGEMLSSDLAGIGVLLASTASDSPNIENTLFAASTEAMDGDLRLLSLLIDWLDIHGERINADRLIQLIKKTREPRVRCFWKAVAQWKRKDTRLRRLLSIYRGPRINLLDSGSDFLIGRHGEDLRFKQTCLRVPLGTLRQRATDILTPLELAITHDTYRQRVVMGPSYRADMWAVLDRVGAITPSELARRTFGSFATAWQVLRDWNLLQRTRSPD
jgi:hypothetical protein